METAMVTVSLAPSLELCYWPQSGMGCQASSLTQYNVSYAVLLRRSHWKRSASLRWLNSASLLCLTRLNQVENTKHNNKTR